MGSIALLAGLCAAAGPKMTPKEIAKAYGPAVVSITTEEADGSTGQASGFIASADGKIVTCHHVIEGVKGATIRLSDSTSFTDILVLADDSLRDLAVLKVSAHGLPAVVLGNSDSLEPGSYVVAIGNPKGLERTISDGLVSGTRKVNDSFSKLQISAPISPGSSGGPVFDEFGRVMGVARSLLLSGQNLNFCVPINYVLPMLRAPTGKPISLGTVAAPAFRPSGNRGGTRSSEAPQDDDPESLQPAAFVLGWDGAGGYFDLNSADLRAIGVGRIAQRGVLGKTSGYGGICLYQTVALAAAYSWSWSSAGLWVKGANLDDSTAFWTALTDLDFRAYLLGPTIVPYLNVGITRSLHVTDATGNGFNRGDGDWHVGAGVLFGTSGSGGFSGFGLEATYRPYTMKRLRLENRESEVDYRGGAVSLALILSAAVMFP
jgi:hypothetical protein